MKLNFTSIPVSQSAIDEVEKAAAAEAQCCQRVVNNGLVQLRALRKAAEDFHTQFKKFEEDFATPAEFKKAFDAMPADVRRVLGGLFLEFDYENVVITQPTAE